MTAIKNGFNVAWKAFAEFSEDGAMTLGAALAFYGALAVAPLFMLLFAVIGFLGPHAQERLIDYIRSFATPQAHGAIETIVKNTTAHHYAAKVSAVLGLIVVIVSATGVFVQLQTSLNRVWNVRPKSQGMIAAWLCKRLVSLLVVFGIGAVLAVSLGITAVLNLLFPTGGYLWAAINLLISLGVYSVLFAIIFKFLPDVKIEWRNVWVGSLITAVLFAAGRYFIGKYLAYSSVQSTYGAAGSFVVLLLWVYYNSLVVFYGAELTQVYARATGAPITPQPHAEWTENANPRKYPISNAQHPTSK